MSGIKNTAGGKTLPKKGRLGSGAYWPQGVPININPFGPNNENQFTNTPPAMRPFGSPSNAGNNTQTSQNRVVSGSGMSHPNRGFYDISKQPTVPPETRDGSTGMFLSPFSANPVVQPNERNRLHSRKLPPGTFHAVSGATRNLPADTAFHRVPPAQRPPAPRPPQNYTTHLVRQKKVGPSFVSKNNQWQDPNQSFNGGNSNIYGEVGKGRWNTIKRGAAG